MSVNFTCSFANIGVFLNISFLVPSYVLSSSVHHDVRHGPPCAMMFVEGTRLSF